MNFELIVAFNNKNVIGNDNKIPWYVPEDLKQFRKTTKNHIVVMGRKTFDSLPNGPLKNRINVVITNKVINNDIENLFFCNFVESFTLLKRLQKETEKKVFIIGGNTIYNQYFEYCTKFHITLIDDNNDGDVFFPYNLHLFRNTFQTIVDETHLSNLDIKFKYYLFQR